MMDRNLAIGIDLGTTNSAIAVWLDGKAILIPNSLGQYLTPSVVSIDEDHHILVGEAAYSRLITKPLQTASAFKRFLGTEKSYQLGTATYTPTELCAMILKSLKSDAEDYLKQSVDDVVISVPAYFNDQQRKEVRQAAELAGLNATRLINEPTAACLAYSLHETHDRRFLVFDLGGGTFDVTVVEYQDSFIEVRASTGDNRLGGEDFTAALVEAVMQKQNISSDDLTPVERSKIIQSCEMAKKKSAAEMSVFLPEPWVQTVQFSAQELKNIWQETLNRLSFPIRQALNDARISPDEIEELIFVGGATRLKEVQQMATRLIGRFGKISLDPDLVVALGAATQAACRLRDEAVEEIVLTDVCPFSLGIASNREGQQGVFSPIIERNTVIPASRVERFYTIHDGQDVVRIAVYQGERVWVAENVLIDEFEVDVNPASAGEESLDVRFSYDINGLLEVDVTVVSTGKTIQKVIDRTPTGMSEAAQLESRKRLEKLKFHPRDALPNITLMEKLNRLYEEKLAEERHWIEQLILHFTRMLETQDDHQIKTMREQIESDLKASGL
ncbi:Hsp70 family protein [Vibrio quintilis]|uniref:Chaperone protein HscC n=1 Tax=Vibrio quintilis TaxID=1117707 RepID=A0A1M7YX71_9VIBR|nr:Hsp70 family protein [Vibrio quintilis]SHO57096.1 Chaperone protein HscC [Vibrio quintilis]